MEMNEASSREKCGLRYSRSSVEKVSFSTCGGAWRCVRESQVWGVVEATPGAKRAERRQAQVGGREAHRNRTCSVPAGELVAIASGVALRYSATSIHCGGWVGGRGRARRGNEAAGERQWNGWKATTKSVAAPAASNFQR